MNEPSALELDFHKAMLTIYHDAKQKCNYNATYFLQMVANEGGIKTARNLLATSEPSDGFTALWECGRLDLTVENLVLKPKYRMLFSPEEIIIAKERLNAYGYKVE